MPKIAQRGRHAAREQFVILDQNYAHWLIPDSLRTGCAHKQVRIKPVGRQQEDRQICKGEETQRRRLFPR
jgi:hypothetical protein